MQSVSFLRGSQCRRFARPNLYLLVKDARIRLDANGLDHQVSKIIVVMVTTLRAFWIAALCLTSQREGFGKLCVRSPKI